MTQPYYYVPQRFLVPKDSPATKPSDLDGKKIGTCTSCTVESYLKGTLVIPGVDLVQKVKDPKLVGFETERPGHRGPGRRADRRVPDRRAGRHRGDQGWQAASTPRRDCVLDVPVRVRRQVLGPPRSRPSPTGWTTSSGRPTRDGTMKALSMKWFGADYTTVAGQFDLGKIGQDSEMRHQVMQSMLVARWSSWWWRSPRVVGLQQRFAGRRRGLAVGDPPRTSSHRSRPAERLSCSRTRTMRPNR